MLPGVLLWLVPAACFCLSPPAFGQTPFSLSSLQPLAEDRARVDVFSGANRALVRGRLLDVTDTAVVVEGRNGTTEIPAADLREVWSPGGARFKKPLIVGTAIGLGFGLLAKAGEGDCNDPTSLCATDGPVKATDVAVLTALGAAGGLGWAWWKRRPRHLLYLSPQAMAQLGSPPDVSGAASGPVRPDWLALAGLEGATVEVAARSSASTLTGTLISTTPQAIQLLVDGEPYVLRQADVRKLWSEPRVAYWRVGLGTLYLGGLWGILVAAAACGAEGDEWTSCDTRAVWTTVGAFGTLLTYGAVRQRHAALAYDSARPVQASSSAFVLQPILGPRAAGIRGVLVFQ